MISRIAQQVEQDLPQAHGVDGQRAKIVRRFDQKAVLVLLGELTRGANDFVESGRDQRLIRVKLFV